MPTLADLLQLQQNANAYVGYPQLQRQAARMQQAQAGRIPENLQDPRTYGFVRGMLGSSPDDLGMSVMSPNTAKAKEAAYYGNQLSNLAQIAPAAAPALKGYGKLAGEAINDAMVYGTGPLAKITPQPMRLDVYHGSPYKFKEFDPTKIGTGEGAQVYGHGLYVAENKKTAQDYMKIEPAGPSAAPRRTLLGQEVEVGTPEYKVAQLVDELGLSKARKFISDWSKNPTPDRVDFVGKASDVIQNVTKKADAKNLGTGNLYKIDLPDQHIEKMLDWDKPLSQQHPEVQKAIQKTKSMLPPNAIDDLGGDLSLMYGKDVTPKDFLNTWESLTGSAGSGEAALAQHGVPGVKYFDQGSRNAKTGTRNFVVFPGNEHLLKIQDINGNPIK